MYDQVEAIASRLGIKPCRAPRLSQVWECWADRVLEADMHDWRMRRNHIGINQDAARRDAMIEAANAYA